MRSDGRLEACAQNFEGMRLSGRELAVYLQIAPRRQAFVDLECDALTSARLVWALQVSPSSSSSPSLPSPLCVHVTSDAQATYHHLAGALRPVYACDRRAGGGCTSTSRTATHDGRDDLDR